VGEGQWPRITGGPCSWKAERPERRETGVIPRVEAFGYYFALVCSAWPDCLMYSLKRLRAGGL